MHLVGWAKLCQPKLYGGLGLKNLQLMNDALLMKLVGAFSLLQIVIGYKSSAQSMELFRAPHIRVSILKTARTYGRLWDKFGVRCLVA